MPPTHLYDDMIQEGYIVWYIVNKRYAAKRYIRKRHIMALFMRAYTNRLTDLANKRRRTLAEVRIGELTDEHPWEFIDRNIGGALDQLELAERLRDLPFEAKRALHQAASARSVTPRLKETITACLA